MLDDPVLTREYISEIIVIDPSTSDSKGLEVIFPNPDGGLYRIFSGKYETIHRLSTETHNDLGIVKKLSVTPPNAGNKKMQLLAILNDENDIIIMESQLETGKAVKFNINDDPPEGICWCSIDSVVLIYLDRLVVVGPNDAKAEFMIEATRGFYACTEIDGMRVLSNDTTYFVEKVPSAIEKSFELASTESSSLIITAYQKYLAGDPRAEDVLKGVKEDEKSSLAEGIKELISAATYEFEPEYQKYLLKAASFAKNFISPGEFNAEDFVRILKDLRIVNQLHVSKVYFVLSIVWTDDNVCTIQKDEAKTVY